MNAKITVHNPDDIEMSLEVTMTLKQWKELRAQLPKVWPSWELGSAITDMVLKAEKTFYPETQIP